MNADHWSTPTLTDFEARIRADERQKVADELRQIVAEQSGWLWYELGESALDKVAAYIAPRAEHQEDPS